MGLLLVATAMALLALPGLLRPLARRLPPHRWTRGTAVILAGGAGVFQLAALLVAAPTVLRVAGVTELAAACERMLGALVPGGPLPGWLAAAGALVVAGRGAGGLIGALRAVSLARIEPSLGYHEGFGAHELVVLPSAELVAVSVPGRPSQIVISERLVEVLETDQLAAVLRHEAAHLEHRHRRFLLLASALESGLAFLPGLRRSTATLRTAVERWADEAATGEDAERRRALHGALLRLLTDTSSSSLAAFSAMDSVRERLSAMEARPPQPSGSWQLLVHGPALALGLAILLALGAWASELRFVLAMAGSCPTD